MGILLEMKIAN